MIIVEKNNIYFRINGKEISVLELMNNVAESKVQAETIQKQGELIQKLSDRLLIIETKQKIK
jgi:hypothetical protein